MILLLQIIDYQPTISIYILLANFHVKTGHAIAGRFGWMALRNAGRAPKTCRKYAETLG